MLAMLISDYDRVSVSHNECVVRSLYQPSSRQTLRHVIAGGTQVELITFMMCPGTESALVARIIIISYSTSVFPAMTRESKPDYDQLSLSWSHQI